jgi:hypothetical protein
VRHRPLAAILSTKTSPYNGYALQILDANGGKRLVIISVVLP